MLDPEKPCVFFDAENNELLVSYPEKPVGVAEFWDYVRCALEENTSELEAFARTYFDTIDGFVDPIWVPSPGVFECAIYEPGNGDLYRSITLRTLIDRNGIHLRVADVVKKHLRFDW